VDHYKCYTVKGTPGTQKFTPVLVSVKDQFIEDQLGGPSKLFNLQKPTRLCNPVDKNGGAIKNEAAHLICYQAKPAKMPPQPKHVKLLNTIHVNSQFGPERLVCCPFYEAVR
jgi:hypothetical protein